MTQEQAGLAQQALNKAAEIGIVSQLDEVENLEVDVQSNPLNVVQGQVDEVTIEGKGLVMQNDLRMEQLEMQMNSIAINPLSAAFGKIELTKPTEASARVVLTEADVNRAFNSEYVSKMLQNLKVQVNGQPVTIDTQRVNFGLPSVGKVALNTLVRIRETGETKEAAFTAVPHVSADGQSVSLDGVEYTEGKELSPDLTAALLKKASEILNFRNFDLKGMSFRIKKLDVEVGKMTFSADAYVEQIPST